MIPNIIHFVFGLKKQKEPFYFVYFLAILSAKIINNPEKIYFHYYYEPYGKWWDKIKKIVILNKVYIPEKFGNKPIIKIAHKADKIRMEILKKYGGIYFDIDTISYQSCSNLLNNNFVMAKEKMFINKSLINYKLGLCNAIMLSEPNSKFLEIWMYNYENYFNPNGWAEASVELPYKLSQIYKKHITILKQDVFFYPDCLHINDIFVNKQNISPLLLTLHLWESKSINYIKSIKNFDWGKKNSDTLYGKIMNNIYIKFKNNKDLYNLLVEM